MPSRPPALHRTSWPTRLANSCSAPAAGYRALLPICCIGLCTKPTNAIRISSTITPWRPPSRSGPECVAHRRHHRTHVALGSADGSASPRRNRAPPGAASACSRPLCPPASGERKPSGRGGRDSRLLARLAARLQRGGHCRPSCPQEWLFHRWVEPARFGRFLCLGGYGALPPPPAAHADPVG